MYIHLIYLFILRIVCLTNVYIELKCFKIVIFEFYEYIITKVININQPAISYHNNTHPVFEVSFVSLSVPTPSFRNQLKKVDTRLEKRFETR